MKTYTVKATKNLIDATGVQCFTKDKKYTFQSDKFYNNNYSLENVTLTNDQGAPHRLGTWEKSFKLVSGK